MTLDIINGRKPLELQSDDLLFKFMKSIHDSLEKNNRSDYDKTDINVDLYFTKNNYDEYNKPYIYKKEDKTVTIKKGKWMEANPDQYIAVLSSDEIYRLECIQRLNYNPDTQRDLIIRDVGGVEVKTIDYNKKSGAEIFSLMANDQYITDTITININPDFYPYPAVIDGDLVITEECVMDLIDGFHRYYNICRAKSKYPNWQFNCLVAITMWNEEKATRFMKQEDHQNHYKNEKVDKLDKSSEANFIVERLDKNCPNFLLKGTLSETDIHVFLKKTIDEIFDVNMNKRVDAADFQSKRRETIIISNQIEKGINAIIEHMDWFGKEFSKTDWFICLYVISQSEENKFDVISLFDYVNKQNLKSINIKRNPIRKHYEILNKIVSKYISEVEHNGII
jgi:hypothetical protein